MNKFNCTKISTDNKESSDQNHSKGERMYFNRVQSIGNTLNKEDKVLLPDGQKYQSIPHNDPVYQDCFFHSCKSVSR